MTQLRDTHLPMMHRQVCANNSQTDDIDWADQAHRGVNAMRKLDGMSILVTGGGSGIGADCARRFCSQGARVTISGRRLEKLQTIKNELGEQCHVVQGDVTVQADRETMLAAAVEHGSRLDALVNNAANMYRQPVDGYTEDFLKDAFDTNVVSAMMLSSMAVPLLNQLKAPSFLLAPPTPAARFRGLRPTPLPRQPSRGSQRSWPLSSDPSKSEPAAFCPAPSRRN